MVYYKIVPLSKFLRDKIILTSKIDPDMKLILPLLESIETTNYIASQLDLRPGKPHIKFSYHHIQALR